MNHSSDYRNEDFSRRYDSDRYGRRFGRHLEELEVSVFLSLIDPASAMILDLGAGTGKLTIPLLLESREVIAADTSPEMLGVAKGKADELDLEIKAVVCDAHQLSFKDSTFDCVVSSRMLMHLGDWRKGVREICRVSSREIIIDFPSIFSFAIADIPLKKLIKLFRPETRVYNNFSIEDVSEEIRKNGFRVTHTKKQFFMPLAFHRWLNRPAISIKIEEIFKILHTTSIFGNPVVMKAVKNV